MTVVAETTNSVLAPRNATRARSTVSCKSCKGRKQRCDRAKPCFNCISRRADLECVYELPKPKKRPRPKAETVGTWLAQPGSEQTSPGSDDWTYVAGNWPSTYSSQAKGAREQLCIPTESLEGRYQPSALCLAENLKQTQFVAADDELKALIKITSSSFRHQPGLGKSDPFDTLPARGPMFDFLLQHLRNQSDPFFSSLPPGPFQYPFSKIWMPRAIESDIGLLVTEYCASVNFDRQRKLDSQPYTVATKSRLLILLNEGLRSSKQFPDELIMAVYSLMHLVASEDFEVHWNGLVTMVNARGGLGEQGVSGIVGNLVSMCFCAAFVDFFFRRAHISSADRDLAALFEREPRLSRPRNYGETTECSPDINMDSPLLPLHRPYAELKYHPRLPQQVADVLKVLQKITWMVTQTFSAFTDITPAINEECQHLLDIMQKSLAGDFHTRREGLMYEALCIAARVYARGISDGTKFSKAFTGAELQNLQDILSTLSRNVWDTVPGVLLFIHLVAQPAARFISTSRAYFLSSQQRLVAPLALVMYPEPSCQWRPLYWFNDISAW